MVPTTKPTPAYMAAPIAFAQNYFDLLAATIARLDAKTVDEIAALLYSAYSESRTVFLFGNGGSASLASHFACDLGKGTTCATSGAKRFRAIALTDNVPLMTAWANDSSYEHIFSEQLANLAQENDVAFAISGSGNSRNVLKALECARSFGVKTIGISGYEGGKMKDLCDMLLVVPSDNMQIIEDIHLSVAHALFTIVSTKIGATEAVAAAAAVR